MQLVKAGSQTVNGLQVTSVGLKECIERVVEASDYRKKLGKLETTKAAKSTVK